jgi:cell division septation protein DedD
MDAHYPSTAASKVLLNRMSTDFAKKRPPKGRGASRSDRPVSRTQSPKRAQATTRSRAKAQPDKPWLRLLVMGLVAGAALGGFGTFLFHVKGEADAGLIAAPIAETAPPELPPQDWADALAERLKKAPPVEAQPAPEVDSRPATVDASELESLDPEPVAEPVKPRFDFYHMLKEDEVPLTEDALPSAQDAEQAAPRTYLLQVASFRVAAEAEALKAKLLLLDLDAKTEAVTVRDHETWHRVWVGPFNNRSQLAKARSSLISNGHQALMLEYKAR